ncbi:uncharacterized protein LOC133478710 isoform X2 [Phyllopteryx taeniolatus]|uniref:uncharacterized protein LOC133478710 isoform X2 n=1 Tax=Phyllopteryx taeniolatus TaxID=161469 RepID=UPI002AD1DAB1|nr:uncharacterized protein LOC133478710 isoform X2 [Phyllopteryx taeniolatus]
MTGKQVAVVTDSPRCTMGSFRRSRPRFMSSPVLSDLSRFHARTDTPPACASAIWNSIQSAVMKIFRGGALQPNELYTLNENIRWLLKSEMGSFVTDYFQNRLLSGGLTELARRIFISGGERLAAVAEAWRRFFTETLPTLQAIFYPIQACVHTRTRGIWCVCVRVCTCACMLFARTCVCMRCCLCVTFVSLCTYVCAHAGSGAVRQADGAVVIPRLGAARAPPGGQPRKRGQRAAGRHAHAAGAAGGARARCSVQLTLPPSGASGGHGGLAVPRRRAPSLSLAAGTCLRRRHRSAPKMSAFGHVATGGPMKMECASVAAATPLEEPTSVPAGRVT